MKPITAFLLVSGIRGVGHGGRTSTGGHEAPGTTLRRADSTTVALTNATRKVMQGNFYDTFADRLTTLIVKYCLVA
jgi:hypothetical protein